MHLATHVLFLALGTALSAFATAYSLIALLAIRQRPRPAAPGAGTPMPVTILKPLCGADSETYACLRSFCEQDHPQYQILFGVREPDDEAVAVVQRLQREFPDRDLRLIVDHVQHGSNRKVNNLINLMPFVRYDWLVVADSDIRVREDYLVKVVAPLADPGVGIVTCAYSGYSRSGIWTLLGSWFINDWFMPSVRVAALTGSRAFAFGATIAMRREVLGAIGGFEAIANQLADDYRLGERTRALGLRTVLSEVQVETSVAEYDLGQLVRHELRWLRTIRSLRPFSYSLYFVTLGVPVALLGCLLCGGAPASRLMLGITATARVALHLSSRRRESAAWQLLLLPLRDLLNLALWFGAFITHRVHWRNDRFRVDHDGSAQPVV
jgi:ceramide glucosyltransferase